MQVGCHRKMTLSWVGYNRNSQPCTTTDIRMLPSRATSRLGTGCTRPFRVSTATGHPERLWISAQGLISSRLKTLSWRTCTCGTPRIPGSSVEAPWFRVHGRDPRACYAEQVSSLERRTWSLGSSGFVLWSIPTRRYLPPGFDHQPFDCKSPPSSCGNLPGPLRVHGPRPSS